MGPDKERNSDGNVPNVNFNSNTGKVNVNYINADNPNENVRPRQKFQQSPA